MIRACCQSYQFQCTWDTHTKTSILVSAVAGTAFLVAFAVSTYFQLLPSSGYGFAGGFFAGSLAIGAIVATLRSQNPVPHIPPLGAHTPNPVQSAAAQAPPFNEASKRATHASIYPHPGVAFGEPTETWPFPTREFTLTLTVDGQLFSYSVPFCYCYTEGENVWKGLFVHNNKLKEVTIHEQRGRKFEGVTHTANLDHRVDTHAINQAIEHPDYLSYSQVSAILSNSPAIYFTKNSRLQNDSVICTLNIPSCTHYELSEDQKTLIIYRDASKPLINANQLEALKNAKAIENADTLVQQLESPEWRYQSQYPITSVEREGDILTMHIRRF